VIVIDVLTWCLRLFGVGYFVGGVWMARQMWFWARITPSMNKLTQTIEEFNAETEGRAPRAAPLDEDVNRSWWLFAGAVITAAAGFAMIFAHRLAVPLLAAIIVHQMLYFIRQRRRERAAISAEAKHEARVNRATINGFFGALVMAVLAAWLYYQDALI
jgi:hypothetical protein